MSTRIAPPAPPAESTGGPPATVGPRAWQAAAAGLVAAAVALGAGELVAGLLRAPSPVIAVGDRVIDLVPGPVKDAAIALFGTNDKIALLAGILVLTAVLGVALGLAAVRRFPVGAAGLALFGAVGVAAALQDAQASPLEAVLPSLAAAAAGIAALALAVRAARLTAHPSGEDQRLAAVATAAGVGDGAGDGTRTGAAPAWTPEPKGRRSFLRTAGGLLVVAAAAGAVGRGLGARATAVASRAAVVLPRPRTAAAAVPTGAALDIDGLSPFVTPNADFYRIDTALQVPQVDVTSWQLRVAGMVDTPLTFTLADLLDRDLVEADVTLACVSNEVGGGLVGNARWLGIPLSELLAEAGVQQGATQIVGRSVDGFTVGFPTEVALDGRDALVAVAMNGEPLPIEHGFPARLVVPGLYGYVSATKWLAEIELTTLEGFDAYWVPRGWAKEAPIKTQSRIDVPRGLANLEPGRTAIAGVAWAQTRGIERVEVQVDDEPWQQARLAEVPGPDTWRQWVYEWDATPGQHRIQVRATDAGGETQPEQRTAPIPDGAAGWHSVVINVRES